MTTRREKNSAVVKKIRGVVGAEMTHYPVEAVGPRLHRCGSPAVLPIPGLELPYPEARRETKETG
jgi:hypothetical protein